jgi:hypothetical protein
MLLVRTKLLLVPNLLVAMLWLVTKLHKEAKGAVWKNTAVLKLLANYAAAGKKLLLVPVTVMVLQLVTKLLAAACKDVATWNEANKAA